MSNSNSNNMKKMKMNVTVDCRRFREKEIPTTQNNLSTSFFKRLKKVYPVGIIHKSNSLLSVSSLASSLASQNSTATSSSSSISTEYFTSSSCPMDQKILASIDSLRRGVTNNRDPNGDHDHDGKEVGLHDDGNYNVVSMQPKMMMDITHRNNGVGGDCYAYGDLRVIKRCHWITKNSDNSYVAFHDEQWGVPAYEDNQLFELLAMSAMLMDHNWTEILKRKNQLSEAFGGFDPNIVANMVEEKITNIVSNKDLGLAECRARCFVQNAKAILKIVKEFGSFGNYLWAYIDYKPVINKYKYPRNVPIRSPRSEAISKDLIKRGFRLVGPVIVHSFMQAAGMSIDHLVDCFRYKECVAVAQNPWRHI